MKKSSVVFIVVALVVVTLGTGAYYFIKQDTAPGDNANVETDGSRYVGDGFSVEQMPGWTVGHMPSTLVSFHNNGEEHPDGSPAAKINFKSYSAITFNMIEGKTLEEAYQTNIEIITRLMPSAEISTVEEEIINGMPAKLAVIDLNQQGVDFKALLVVYLAGDKYYTLSFNTTAEKWLEYEEEFYAVVRSFMTASMDVEEPVSGADNAPVFTEADMEKGWYYGEQNQKKTGTPASWLHRFEGTRSAMWYDPARLDI